MNSKDIKKIHLFVFGNNGLHSKTINTGNTIDHMRNLLIFYPSNKRTVAMETLMIALNDKNINVKLLTSCKKGAFHKELEKNGIETFTLQKTSKVGQIFELKRFCKQHKIEVIHSHLQAANLIAVFAQFIISAKVIIFRHHFEMPLPGIERNKNELRGERIINKFARKIIVPSSGVYNGMRDYEKVNMNKVEIVPYIYDFSKYNIPENDAVKHIINTYPCKLLLLICARHVIAKRHILVFEAVKKLVAKGLDIKLLVMDDGPERKNLETFVQKNRLADHIHFLGFKTDFINYFKASDILLHSSVIDASNSVVKEMAMLEKTALVCKGIGDFSDYFVDRKNGFLMDPNDSAEQWSDTIQWCYEHKEKLNQMGENLRSDVLTNFSVSEENIQPYLNLI